MRISNVSIVGEAGLQDILIHHEKITAVCDPGLKDEAFQTGISLSFREAVAFPGLINSHDHLDFNLFPPLGNKIYANYTAWGQDIHKAHNAEIGAVLKIPQSLRTKWGIYKNVLNGVTTVVNHGKWLVTDKEDSLIGVFQDCHSLHSVGFEKSWKWKLNRPFTGSHPFVMHVGEGTDKAAGLEIDRLIGWNLFKRPLIGIHGVAMNEKQAEGFRALIWCPASNYFLLDRTARVGLLKKKLPILFGTDSTLTASWNIWEQLRLARKEKQLTDEELLDALTIAPATVWGLSNEGRIGPGRYADLVIARSAPKTQAGGDPKNWETFYALNPEDILLVLHRGAIRLFDDSLYDSLGKAGFAMENYKKVTVNDKGKYVWGDLPGLLKKIREYHPGASLPAGIE
jgi:cytosine/adenosine deaminase-related metal-dependent hydrolase